KVASTYTAITTRAQPLNPRAVSPTVTRVIAAKLSPDEAQTCLRTLRRVMTFVRGASTSTPPRIHNIMKTIEAPSKLKASVVVPMIAATHSPEREGHSPGRGREMPPRENRLADFHHRVATTKTAAPTSETRVVTGRMAR